jgi:hypothetical protein
MTLTSLGPRSALGHEFIKLRLTTSSLLQRRNISDKVLVKRQLAQAAWERKAERIKAGETYNLWDVLNERGYVKDTAGYAYEIQLAETVMPADRRLSLAYI